MHLLEERNNRRIESEEISILAEPRNRNPILKLYQRITNRIEERFYFFVSQLIEKENRHLEPWHSRIMTQYSISPPSNGTKNEIERREQDISIELPPLPPLDFSPSKHRKRPRSISFHSYENWTKDFPSIRPGMSVRVIHAERTDTITQYVIQVVDLHTKMIWTVRKRFRELYAFRKEIKGMCKRSPYGDQLKYLFDHLSFPKRSVQNVSSEIILKRRLVLETFLRNIASLSPDTQLHVAIIGKLQMELCSIDFIRRLATIEPMEDLNELKWLAFDLFRNINSCYTIEGDTCQRFLDVFRNRCGFIQKCVRNSRVDHKTLAHQALHDLRNVTTEIEHYIFDTLGLQYRRAITTAMCDGHTIEEIDVAIEECIYVTVEDAIMVPLQEQIQYLVELTIDSQHEAILTYRMEHELYGKSQSFFSIPDSLQNDSNYGKACYHLSMMEERILPCEKLKELVLSANEIFSACGDQGFPFIGHGNSVMNADDFLPIHIYAVVHSGLKRPYFTKEVLSAMIHPSKMLGEVGYFLTMFEAALKYVSESM